MNVYLYVVSDSDTWHLELHKRTQPSTERPCSLFTQGLLDRPHYFIIYSSNYFTNHFEYWLVDYLKINIYFLKIYF